MKIEFPVITFQKQNIVLSIRNEDILTRCGKRGLKNGCYENLFIVDSSGRGYTVNGARNVGYAGRFWGFSLLTERKLRVELQFDSGPVNVPLEELKERVCKALDAGPRLCGGSEDIEDIKARVRVSKSHREIIDLLF
jgi:hypothetical protein